MAATTTHTPVPAAQARPGAAPVVITGVVQRKPEVRTCTDGSTLRTIPILHLWLEVKGQAKPVVVQQPFRFCEMAGAHAAAARYQVGSTVSIECDLADLQLTLHNVQHIRLQKQPHPGAQAH